MSKRTKTEDYIVKNIRDIAGDENAELYIKRFKELNDKEFDDFMVGLRDGRKVISIIAPIGSNNDISVKKNLSLAKNFGFKFLDRIVINGEIKYSPDPEFLTLRLPFRRTAQLLKKKVSVPKHNKVKDLLTGQVTGDSASSKLTLPETQILLGLGLEESTTELLKYRGGDLGGGNAMETMLFNNGTVRQDVIENYSTGTESSKTLKAYFNGMHISSTL